MKKLICTKTEEILEKGKKKILNYLKRNFNEMTFYKNGRIYVLLDNGESRHFTTSQLNEALRFVGEWTSPNGVDNIYKIID